MKTCGAKLASGQWWHFCGETDMGQTMPVQCERCNPEDGLKLPTEDDDNMDDDEFSDEMKDLIQNTPPNERQVQMPETKDTNPKDGCGSLKPSYSCVPTPVLYELGAALTEGARKYGGYNWRVAGVRASVYIDATRRHLDAWWEGEDIDPDSGLSHITKAIASLTVFRDAQIQGMVQNDDRPPRTEAPFMAEGTERMAELVKRRPNPVPNYTEEQVAHTRNTPVSTYGGQTLGYDIEVMVPADTTRGYVWSQQGGRRTDMDQALAVAQALRDDGYGERVVRVMRAMQRVEQMADSTEYIVGEMREQLTTVFPGDPSLMELTEEEATELEELEELEESDMTDEAIRQEIAESGGGFDEYGNRVDPIEDPGPCIVPDHTEQTCDCNEYGNWDDLSQPDPFGGGKH